MRKSVRIFGRAIPLWLIATVLIGIVCVAVTITYFGTIHIPWKITPPPAPPVTVTMSPDTVRIPELSIPSGQTSTYRSEEPLAQIVVSGGTASVTAELTGDLYGFSAFTATVTLVQPVAKLEFDIEETEESFLLVFIDTREGGTIYNYGDTGTDIRADYMIVDPAVNDGIFGGWYLGKWLREDLGDPYTGWSTPSTYDDDFEDNDWDCEGFVAVESRADEVTHYEFTIPLECIEYNPAYGLRILIQTDEGFGEWQNYDIGITFELSKDSPSCTQTVPIGEYAIYLEISATAITTDTKITGEAQIKFSYA